MHKLLIGLSMIILVSLLFGCVNKKVNKKDLNNETEEYWSEEGELSLALVSEKNSMDYNKSLNITYRLINVGNTTIGVLDWNWPWVKVFDQNNTPVEWIGDVRSSSTTNQFGNITEVQYYRQLKITFVPTNEDIKVLEPDEFIEYNNSISGWIWDIKSNESYSVKVVYRSFEMNELTKPYWKGEIWSNVIYFDVM